MKHWGYRLLVSLLLATTVGVDAFGDSYFDIDRIPAEKFNAYTQRTQPALLEVGFRVDEKKYLIAFADNRAKFHYFLSHSTVAELRKSLNKFLEWEAKATKMQVTIRKDIARHYWDKGYWSDPPSIHWADEGSFTVEFVSQSKTDHRSYLHFAKFESSRNKFIGHAAGVLVLTSKAIKQLLSATEKDRLRKAYKAFKKQQEIEAEFQ